MSKSSAIQFFKLPAAEYAVAGSTRAWDSIPFPAATNVPQTSQRIRSRSRSNDSCLRPRNRSRRIDPEILKQMSDEHGPGGFFTEESHSPVVNSPPIQNFFED